MTSNDSVLDPFWYFMVFMFAGLGSVISWLYYSSPYSSAPGIKMALTVFAAVLAFPLLLGYAFRPTKSHREVEAAKEQKERAERKAREMTKAKEEAEKKMKGAQKKARKIKQRNEELEESVRKRQENMTEEINEKAEAKAEDLAEEKAAELLEDWKKEERKNLADEKDLSNLAYLGRIRDEAGEKVEEIRSKLRDFLDLLIQDEEMLQLIEDRGIEDLTVDELEVFIKTDRDPDLKKELDQVIEVNGDLDLWMDRKIEEIEDTEIDMKSDTIESETDTEEKKDEEDENEEPDEGDGPKGIWESLDEESQNILILVDEGFNTSSSLAETADISKRTVERRYNKLSEKDLIRTGINGVSLTPKGKETLEAIT